MLDFLLENKHGLLRNPDEKHVLADKAKRSKHEEKLFRSYNSQIILQETILALAKF